jgi:hypothetical protein
MTKRIHLSPRHWSLNNNGTAMKHVVHINLIRLVTLNVTAKVKNFSFANRGLSMPVGKEHYQTIPDG